MSDNKENNNIKELIDFSSDDDDDDDDSGNSLRENVRYQVQENQNNTCQRFKEFLSDPKLLNPPKTPKTNIIDRHGKKCYTIPDKKIARFFGFLEWYRRSDKTTMIYEKQLEYSGIMIDVDMHLETAKAVNGNIQFKLTRQILITCAKYLNMPDPVSVDAIITSKPKPVYNTEKKFYKHGFHVIIPSLKVTKGFKRLLISELQENANSIFSNIAPHNQERKDFIDVNSSHVGVHFVGSSTKVNTPPYQFCDILRTAAVKNGILESDVIPNAIANFPQQTYDNGKLINLCYECSINWEAPNGKIKKKNYDILPEFKDRIALYESQKTPLISEFERDKNYNDLSALAVHDPDFKHIKALLDILCPSRVDNYGKWYKVICVLASQGKSYKPLAVYYSKQSTFYKECTFTSWFDGIWSSACGKSSSKLGLGSLHYWAKLDNPDGYIEIKNRNSFSLIYKKLYEKHTDGILEHNDVAKILHKNLQHKYAYDSGDYGGTWYEFMLDGDIQEKGEMYKWRRYEQGCPKSLGRYMSNILPRAFSAILTNVEQERDRSDDVLRKYHSKIHQNLKATMRKLGNTGFKSGVMSACAENFENIGFTKHLDKNPLLMGVGNGILDLTGKPTLLTGYHGHMISKFTEIDYVPFDPHNPITKKVLMTIRNLFPDNEPDTHDFYIHFFASTLDGRPKESIMMISVGGGANGKSFVVELHKGTIGEIYAVKMPISFLTSRSKNADNATPALMQLKDAHFAYYSESNQCEVMNSAKVKEFTGQETLAGRALHKGYENFRPKCHHLVSSNYDFMILGNDHGTWRRIVYVPMKIKFYGPGDSFDPDNKYERKADPSIDSWATDPEILSSYLSVLVWYYQSLMNKYEGKIKNVPHPHIKKDTEEFRSRQDTVNNFINTYYVSCSDKKEEVPLQRVVTQYITWYDAKYPSDDKSYKKGLYDQFKNSKIHKHFVVYRQGVSIKGYRFLSISDKPADGESYVYSTDIASDIDGLKSENTEQYYARICREYDAAKIFDQKQKSDMHCDKKNATHSSNTKNKERQIEMPDSIKKVVKKVANTKITKKEITTGKYGLPVRVEVCQNVNSDSLLNLLDMSNN
jgi:phage/plasmid-associated DNA primase